MYLSRLRINLNSRQALRLVTSPYCMHAAVEGSFSEGAARKSSEGRILWRIDHIPHDERAVWLYVVSPEQPDPSRIAYRCGQGQADGFQTRDYSRLLEYVSEGQEWQFRLKANPSRKVMRDQGRVANDRVVGKVQGHVTVEQQLKWLTDRTEDHGFAIPYGEAAAPMVAVSNRHRERYKRQGSTVTVDTAVYDGILMVTDADLLRHTLCFGMGRAKGFGCGLLTLAPV